MGTGKSAKIRSVIFWARLTEQYMLTFVGTVIVFLGLYFLTSSKEQMESFFSAFPMFAISFIALLIFSIINANQLYVSVSVSFGSTRKNAFLGIQLMKLLLILQMSILLILFDAIHKNHFFSINRIIVINMIVLLFTCGLGDLFHVLMRRFEKGGRVIYVFMCGLFGGITGVMAVNVQKRAKIDVITWLNFDGKEQVLVIAGIVAGVIYLLGGVLYYRIIKKMEVKS